VAEHYYPTTTPRPFGGRFNRIYIYDEEAVAVIWLQRRNSDDIPCIVDVADLSDLAQYAWYSQVAPHIKGFYARRNGRGQTLMHRMIMGAETGSPLCVDHINHNALDNRRCNLRFASRTLNSLNRSDPRTGVTRLASGNYSAAIKVIGQNIKLGIFDTEHEAMLVRLGAFRVAEVIESAGVRR
jgi:hypothetical protein